MDADGNADLVVDFGSPFGVNGYFNNTPPWVGIHHLSPGVGKMTIGEMEDASGQAELVVSFTSPYGVNAMYNNAGWPNWTGLHQVSASSGEMAAGDLDGN